jgi:hypothetical protein
MQRTLTLTLGTQYDRRGVSVDLGDRHLWAAVSRRTLWLDNLGPNPDAEPEDNE